MMESLPFVWHASNIISIVYFEQSGVGVSASGDEVLGIPAGITVPYGSVVRA